MASLGSVSRSMHHSTHAPGSVAVIQHGRRKAQRLTCHSTAAVLIVPKEDTDGSHVSAAQLQPPGTIQQKAIHIFEYSSICNPFRQRHVAKVFQIAPHSFS
ncbi:hypothetical protein ASV20_10605 [Enterobacter roggenkampii]|nr:hypothetical protein ES15_3409 [Cronobacter sakazakii ES15]KTH72378.1 hypothetical protein ASV20_10605 [Enterobacter roggenkampii]